MSGRSTSLVSVTLSSLFVSAKSPSRPYGQTSNIPYTSHSWLDALVSSELSSTVITRYPVTSLSSRTPPEQHLGFLLEGDWAWHPAPALSCFVWGRVPVSGTTISGARPLPLITEQSWISAQAVSTPQSHSLTICSASASPCWRPYKIQHRHIRFSMSLM